MQIPEFLKTFWEKLKDYWEKLKTDRTVQLISLCVLLGVLLVALVIKAVFSFQPEKRPEYTRPTLPPSTWPESTRPDLPPPEANPYTPEDFYSEYGILKCSKAETIMGIDVSSHQKEIDWQQVADAGVQYVFIRIGYRGYIYGGLSEDEYYAANIEGAQAAGIRVGAYFFSQALSVAEAKEEAEFALELLEGYELDLPLVFDWERMGEESRTAQIQPRTLTNITKTFCQIVEAAGYEPMIYFNSNQAKNLLYLEELTEYKFWLAMYDTTMEFPYKFDIWQYTNKGRLPGIETNVDVNLMFVEERNGEN